MKNNYENYHSHSHYSNIYTPDCIVRPKDLAKRAVKLGQKTLSSVEHGFIGNLFEYYDVAKEYNLKLIVGAEFYFVPDRKEQNPKNYHMVVLAKNNDGVKEIKKIMSIANQDGYYYKPRIDLELLMSLTPGNVVVTTACLGSFIRENSDVFVFKILRELADHFKNNFYLEVQCHTNEKQVKYNEKIKYLHKVFKIPLIHGCDTHYISMDDGRDRDIFIRGKGIEYPDEQGFLMDYPTIDEIRERYKQQNVLSEELVEQALSNTNILLDFEEITMSKEIKMPSIFGNLSINEKLKKLKNIIYKEFDEQYTLNNFTQEELNEYKKEIKSEYDIIEKTSDVKTVDYFLLNYLIIKKAVKEYDGVLTRTGRGSAPSFLINKLLGFTNIDRIKSPVKLYPTRFMSVSRILEAKSLPDIDFNVANPEPFIRASKDYLGEDGVVGMIAYGTFKEGAAFRNLCRSKGMDYDDYNEVAKELGKYRNNPKWKKIIEETQKFVGVIDSMALHPCAYVLLSQPIDEELGIIKAKDNYVCLIDSTTADNWKYLKNDYLTVTVWEIISEVYKMIDKPIDTIDSLVEKLDDKVWKLYEDKMTATLNQTNSDFATPKVSQYKPKNVAELSAFVAAIRPGFSSMVDVFLNREPFSYNIKEFDKLLDDSQNFVLYQENVMTVLQYAGFPGDETYSLLKAIAKKKPGIIEPIEERFKKGFGEKLGDVKNKDGVVQRVWQIIVDNVGYSFNSSHSLATALDSLYGAYLKANYPLEYYTVVLNIYKDDKDETTKIVNELNYFGIKLNPIKFRYSKNNYRYNRETNSIYKGVASIKFLSENVAKELYDLGKKEFSCFTELYKEIFYNTSCDARQLEILVKSDFFSDFGDISKLLHLIHEYKHGKQRLTKLLKQETINKRFLELCEYEKNLKEYEKISQLDLIRFKVENNLPIDNLKGIDNRTFIITELNNKFKNVKITMLQVSTGDYFDAKIKASSLETMPTINKYDFIKITRLVKENQWYNKDGKWKQYEDKDNRKEYIVYGLQLIDIIDGGLNE